MGRACRVRGCKTFSLAQAGDKCSRLPRTDGDETRLDLPRRTKTSDVLRSRARKAGAWHQGQHLQFAPSHIRALRLRCHRGRAPTLADPARRDYEVRAWNGGTGLLVLVHAGALF